MMSSCMDLDIVGLSERSFSCISFPLSPRISLDKLDTLGCCSKGSSCCGVSDFQRIGGCVVQSDPKVGSLGSLWPLCFTGGRSVRKYSSLQSSVRYTKASKNMPQTIKLSIARSNNQRSKAGGRAHQCGFTISLMFSCDKTLRLVQSRSKSTKPAKMDK